ncbi:MAG: ACT domain-containing protein [Aquificaceae bacterium]|nr:ACT domain-containing protein [Aquificaceae bacterium]MDW8096653.1 ACT domain-containing protein [Aquificaceae bacterium]
MKFFMLSLFGKDRPGIVARVSKVLYEMGLNLEESSMTRLRDEFTIMLIVSSCRDISSEELLANLREVSQELGLFLMCKEVEERECPRMGALYRLVVFGSDKPGIVYAVSSKLASLGFNISDLRTEKAGGLYVMVLQAEGREEMEQVLREGLEEIKHSVGVDISLEREEEERL